METFKTVKSQIVNPSPNRDKLNRARAKLERPSIIKLREVHRLVKVAENPVLDIIDQPIEPGDLQKLLKSLYERKALSNTIIADPSIVEEPINARAPDSSIGKTPANSTELSSRAKLRQLMNGQPAVS